MRMKMPNAELYLKEARVNYDFYLLAARLPELTSKLERLDCSTCSASNTGASFQLIALRVSDDTAVQFVEMTGAVATKQASVTTLHVLKSCL